MAHAHAKYVGRTLKQVREMLGKEACIMAGNVATYAGADYLASCSADIVKVGIGGGSVCTTRIKTGFGVPNLTAIRHCTRVDRSIVADGSTESLKESAGNKKNIHLSLQNASFKSVETVLSAIDGITGIARVEETDDHLDVRIDCQSSVDPRASIYQAIKQTDWILLDFHQKPQTLEIIFRELTRESA